MTVSLQTEIRLAVLADTHGNLPALQAVLQDLQPFDIDGIIVAGDLTAGPHPNQTIRLLQEHNAWFIRGNTDENILRYAAGDAPKLWGSSKQWAVMRWSLDRLHPTVLRFLQALPGQRVVNIPGADPIRMVHGSLRSSVEGLYPDRFPERLAAALDALPEPVLVCAHTHQPWHLRRDGKLVLNPGSVAGPLNGDTRAQYALLNWSNGAWRAEHRAVGYDLRLVRDAFIETGLYEEGGALARAFLLSIESGYDVARDFFALIRQLLSAQNLPGIDVVPDEIWGQAAERFAWEQWDKR